MKQKVTIYKQNHHILSNVTKELIVLLHFKGYKISTDKETRCFMDPAMRTHVDIIDIDRNQLILPLEIKITTDEGVRFDLTLETDFPWFITFLRNDMIPPKQFSLLLASRNGALIAFTASQKKVAEMQADELLFAY